MGNVVRVIQQLNSDVAAYALATICIAGLVPFTASVLYNAIQLEMAVGFYIVVLIGHLLGVLVLLGRTIEQL